MATDLAYLYLLSKIVCSTRGIYDSGEPIDGVVCAMDIVTAITVTRYQCWCVHYYVDITILGP